MKFNFSSRIRSPRRRIIQACLLILLTLTAVSCQPVTPRLATATAQAQAAPTNTPEPVILSAPPGTAVSLPVLPPAGPIPSLTIWINETSPEHAQALNQMAVEFSRANQIDVELMLVAPTLLPKLMATAVLSDALPLPDIVLHPIEYTMGWAEQGILDTVITGAILDEIGRDTFDPNALAAVTQNGAAAAAIPSDGYPQLLIYRADWLRDFDLSPPDNYDAMLTMAQTISNTQALISGFVIPTESNLVATHQAFEQIAAANGCQLIDETGEVRLLEPVCQEALDFYFNIVHNYSPTGVQTDTSARNAYLAGRAGLIMSTPAILPQLAGLDSSARPTCKNCTADSGYLAQNSGIITHLNGRDPAAQPVNLGEMTNWGITNTADRETAAAFIRYWFNEGYPVWLAVESERKIPLRWGTADQPRQFIDAWGQQPLSANGPSLSDLYGAAIVAQLRDAVTITGRWGLPQEHGALVTSLYEELTFSVTLQEMLSGYFNPNQTLVEIAARTIDLIPNYAYDVNTSNN